MLSVENSMDQKNGRSRASGFFLFALMLAVVFWIVYGFVFSFSFLGIDDHVYVVNNPYVRQGLTWSSVKWAFSADLLQASPDADYWQPLTFLSRMLDVQLFGMHAGWHHVHNVVLHFLNTLFVFVLVRRFQPEQWIAGVIAFAFALHPFNVEVMGWVTARKDVLSVLFYLSTIWVYTYPGKRKGYIWVVLLLMAVGLLAKPIVITLPALLIALEWFVYRERSVGVLFRKTWMLWVLAVAYVPIPFLGQPQAVTYPLNAVWAKALTHVTFYLSKFLVPFHTTLYAPVPEQAISILNVCVSAIVFAVISVIAWKNRERCMWFVFGWVAFLILSAPVLGLQWPADRFMYLPKLALILMGTECVRIILRRMSFAFVLKGIVIWCLGLAVLSYTTMGYWKNSETLLTRVLVLYPQNYAAHNVLGVVYGQKQDYAKASYHLEKAVDIFPERDKPWHNLGMMALMQKRYTDAEQYFLKAMTFGPADYQVLANLGNVYAAQGKFTQAVEVYEKALKQRPQDPDLQNNLRIIQQRSQAAGETSF